MRARIFALGLIGTVAALSAPLLTAVPAQAATPSVSRSCNAPASPGQMSCFALRRTGTVTSGSMGALTTPSGYGPTDLRSAYNLNAAGGTGATVAIVDAYDDPNAEADLAAYRTQFGLTACTTANGCFRKVNQNGAASPLPSPDSGWASEISLDLDMVSAVCPNCHLLLVEANSSFDSDLFTAEDEAVALGAKYVSNSWGGSEWSGQSTDDAHFNHPGVVITASSGDNGVGASYPATSRYVTAVGGTSLSRASNTRGWTESAWSGAGSGCSAYDAKPSWQTVSTACASRAESDVSAVADPYTGVAVYDTYGSASAPIVAAVYALAGTPGASDYPAAYPYANPAALFDVTSGNNGACGPPGCAAGAGWDGPTGLGTPNGTAAFTGSGSGTNPPPAGITVTNPGAQTSVIGAAINLTLHASGGTGGYVWSATHLPNGLTVNASTGVISGTPTLAGTFTVGVTAMTRTGSGTASFTWTVVATPEVAIAPPGNQAGVVGTPTSLTLHASGGTGSYTWSSTARPAGLVLNSTTGVISGTPTAAGTTTVSVTVRSGSKTATASFTWTVVLPACPTGQVFGNAGFESGTAPWSATSGVLTSNAEAPQARTGTHYAWLDGYGVAHTDTLSQTLTVPLGCHTATLTFWLQISSQDAGTTAHDTLTVKVNGVTVGTYSNLDRTGYVPKSISLSSSYVGKQVTITFTGTEDTSKATSFVVDDTALTIG